MGFLGEAGRWAKTVALIACIFALAGLATWGLLAGLKATGHAAKSAVEYAKQTPYERNVSHCAAQGLRYIGLNGDEVVCRN